MKIALLGYGKMGKEIERIALERNHEIILKISEENLEDNHRDNLRKADIAIEFSGPHSAIENIFNCFDAGIPIVCGSTGWQEKIAEVEAACTAAGGALFYSSNFSIGVNILFAINIKLASIMGDYPEYDIELEEIHHTQKIDSPSGTAISLAGQILSERADKQVWVNRPSQQAEEVPIISKREENVPGTHHVRYRSSIDEIQISHTAFNRRGFASGAVAAAEFLSGKKGVFGMGDLLGI